MTTHVEELERTLASDPILTAEENAATIKLARDLAAELDAQIVKDGTGQTRTIATYAGLLGNLRRIVRDERDQRRRTQARDSRPASRLSLIKDQATKAQRGPE